MDSWPSCRHLHQAGWVPAKISARKPTRTCFADVLPSVQAPFTQTSDSLPRLHGCCEQQYHLTFPPQVSCPTWMSHSSQPSCMHKSCSFFCLSMIQTFQNILIAATFFPSLFTSYLHHQSFIFFGSDMTRPVSIRPFQKLPEKLQAVSRLPNILYISVALTSSSSNVCYLHSH